MNEIEELTKQLITASRVGDTKTAKLLIKAGANIHSWEDCAVRWASKNGHTEIVKLLIEADANIHAENDCAVREASRNCHTNTVKLLIDAGANIHSRDDCSVRWASQNGHTETVLYIIQHHTFPFQRLSEQHKKLLRERLSVELLEHFIPDLANLISDF
jgi:ankyrin repeat protein